MSKRSRDRGQEAPAEDTPGTMKPHHDLDAGLDMTELPRATPPTDEETRAEFLAQIDDVDEDGDIIPHSPGGNLPADF